MYIVCQKETGMPLHFTFSNNSDKLKSWRDLLLGCQEQQLVSKM